MKESTGEKVELENEVEEGERRLRDIEIECEESGFQRILQVYIPNKIEFEAHCRTHVPYRSWCPICVQAKKRNPPHVTAKTGDHRGTPVISGQLKKWGRWGKTWTSLRGRPKKSQNSIWGKTGHFLNYRKASHE